MRLAALFDEVVACLAAEHAEAHARMHEALGDVEVEGVVAGEDVRFGKGGGRRVTVATDLETLCAVLLGEVELLAALDADRIVARGDAEDLARLDDALRWFLEGAVRCVTMNVHVDRLLTMRGETNRA